VAPRVLGVDDWAWRRGHRCGTVLVDLEPRAVVDLLPDRDADSFAAWLRAHPGVEVIARGRGAVYADGGRRGEPGATHVADRWHLLGNCGAAVLNGVKRHMPVVRRAAEAASEPAQTPSQGPPEPPSMTSAQRRQWAGWRRRAEAHERVMSLRRAGASIKQVSRDLAPARDTVRRWPRGEQPDPCRPRAHSLEPWRALLERRGAEGCRNAPSAGIPSASPPEPWPAPPGSGVRGATPALPEGCASSPHGQAVSGSPARQWRRCLAVAPPPPAARRAARIMTVDFPSLKQAERTHVERLLALSPALDAVRGLARRFAAMVRARDADALGPRLVEAAGSELNSFAQGLKHDDAAVRAALTLAWSRSAVEGNVTRLKLIKPQGCGRAKLDLLRARVLHAA